MFSFILWGPPGCGKTTITRFLNGLIPNFFDGKKEGEVYLNNDLREIMVLTDIYVAEEESIVSLHSEWFYKDSWQEIYECYNDVRLIMIRIEHGKEDDRIELLREKVKLGIITEQAITMIADRLFEDSRKVRSIIFG